MIPLTFVNVLRLTIQGMGYSRLALFAGVFEMIARGGVGLFLVPLFGFNAACFSGPIAWILADSFLIPMYYHVIHRAKTRRGYLLNKTKTVLHEQNMQREELLVCYPEHWSRLVKAIID